MPTPAQTRGPFYPAQRPPDSDFDLTRIEGRAGRARGDVIDIVGRVLDLDGRPVERALVQIWQANEAGRYDHPRERSSALADPDFQGFGEVASAADGLYRFRTIKPGAYAGRTSHIHFMVLTAERPALVTQMYFAGEKLNPSDPVLRGLSEAQRRSVTVAFDSNGQGRFDIVFAGA
ncbi:MAG: intradiol ring-cleavage dioxygenase [Alphaproteobacteria bacterium]|nr:intradiol ring-cleavage dioxygenase [Alphaproteobacteria bacterium]